MLLVDFLILFLPYESKMCWLYFSHSDPDLENLDTEAIQSQSELPPKNVWKWIQNHPSVCPEIAFVLVLSRCPGPQLAHNALISSAQKVSGWLIFPEAIGLPIYNLQKIKPIVCNIRHRKSDLLIVSSILLPMLALGLLLESETPRGKERPSILDA